MNKAEKELLNDLFLEAIIFFEGDPKRIQHFVKVHSFAKLIAEREGLDERSLFTLEATAYLHDIGIRIAERKYGHQNGKLQEQEGPPAAEKLMNRLGFPEDVIHRACQMIGHHHTYSDIDGLDLQILIEADFLVNMYEDNEPVSVVRSVRDKIFRTETGSKILQDMFLSG